MCFMYQLVKRGYIHNPLFKHLKKVCLTYKIEEKYCEKNYNLPLSRMIKYSPPASCDINNVTGMKAIVKTC